MQILSQLGLMFRANMLRQLSAKVELASTHYSPSRFTAALTGINNQEQQLAERFSRGHLSLEKLQRQATRLASHEVILNARLTPEADKDVSPARQPVQTATAFRSVLLRASLDALGQQQHPLALRVVLVHVMELLAHMREQALQRAGIGQVIGRRKVHAHEEQPGAVLALHIAKLLRVDDVAAGLVQQARHGVNDASGVPAGQGQNEFVRGLHDGERL